MRQKLVAGNWKMNGDLQANQALLTQLQMEWQPQHVPQCGAVKVLLCVPSPYLAQAQSALQGSAWLLGAQNVSEYPSGAYTGEVSVAMLAELGCAYVLVGHSERRALFGETDEVVAAKFCAALAGGLIPILCVGESLEEREAGAAEVVIGRQLDVVLSAVGVQGFQTAVVAYEPVWAIGTGKTASPQQAQTVHAFIRQRLAQHDLKLANQLVILYGGSVKANNAAELFAMPDIDGGLVGGASLVADEFLAICKAACS